MNTPDDSLPTHPKGEQISHSNSDLPCIAPALLPVETFSGRIHVEWDPQAAVTPLGQLAFFIEFLKTAELFDPWVEECPLEYHSPNAPAKRNVLGTAMLSILSGHKRYAHITSIRGDGVNPNLLEMSKVTSEDSVRRAFKNVDKRDCADWQRRHLRHCYNPLLAEPWILDIDTTVKPLYGHQEGAVVGYNPQKPGRPSHAFHTYFIANLRLILDVEVQPGNKTASSYSRPGLYEFIDSLAPALRPAFIRGDVGFGNEGMMKESEDRAQPYLFKIRQTSKVKGLIDYLFSSADWVDAGQGWQGCESTLQLSGWTRERRVVVVRRELKKDIALEYKAKNGQQEFAFLGALDPVKKYEYAVYVTSLCDEICAISQHYRDRADCENPFDELKNQWSWGGFTTRDIDRCQIMARHTALFYNWWSIFVGLAISERHAEAITSRPLMLYGVAKQTTHAGQRRLTITSMHGSSERMSKILTSLSAFFSSLRSSAEQLGRAGVWRIILSRAFMRFLGGRLLREPRLIGSSP